MGTWLLVNVGEREFPAWKAGLAANWGTVGFSLSLLETAPPGAELDAPARTVQPQSPGFSAPASKWEMLT